MAPAPRQAARRVAAVSRALAVMDALAAGGELGTNELARRTGVNASTVSRLLATLASAGYVDQADERPLPARDPPRAARERGRRPARPSRARPPRARAARRARRRDRDALGRRGPRGDHRRLRPEPVVGPGRRAARPAERRACDRDRQGAARVRGHRGFRRGPSAATRRRTIADPRALAREIERVRARGWADAVGSARTTSRRSPRRSGEAAASSRRSSASRGPTARLDAKARAAALEPFSRAPPALSQRLGWVES